MSKMSSGGETFTTETRKDLRLWFSVLLCGMNLQLMQALFQTSILLKDSSLIEVIL